MSRKITSTPLLQIITITSSLQIVTLNPDSSLHFLIMVVVRENDNVLWNFPGIYSKFQVDNSVILRLKLDWISLQELVISNQWSPYFSHPGFCTTNPHQMEHRLDEINSMN